MALVLSRFVTVFDGISQFSARSAVIELHDDDTFVLAKVDAATGAQTEVIFNTPLRDLTVGGSMATLTFKVGGVKKRVDFSFGSRVVGALGGVIGMAAQGNMIKNSGIMQWVDTFKMRGTRVRYLGMGKIVLWTLVGVIGVFVIIGVVVGIAVAVTPQY